MGTPRVVWRSEKQAPLSYLDVWTDSDHAGCTKSRRSTSAAVLMAGHHILRLSSTTQTVVALSSGESVFYAIVKITLMVNDHGHGAELKPRIGYVAAVGAGIANRRGFGCVRHCHTSCSFDATSCLGMSGHVEERRRRRERRGFENETSRWALLEDKGIVKMTRQSEPSLRVSGDDRFSGCGVSPQHKVQKMLRDSRTSQTV